MVAIVQHHVQGCRAVIRGILDCGDASYACDRETVSAMFGATRSMMKRRVGITNAAWEQTRRAAQLALTVFLAGFDLKESSTING